MVEIIAIVVVLLHHAAKTDAICLLDSKEELNFKKISFVLLLFEITSANEMPKLSIRLL